MVHIATGVMWPHFIAVKFKSNIEIYFTSSAVKTSMKHCSDGYQVDRAIRIPKRSSYEMFKTAKAQKGETTKAI